MLTHMKAVLMSVILLLLMPAGVWAQTDANAITGTVVDEKGQLVAAAEVVATGAFGEVSVHSNEEGRFALQAPSGPVTLQVRRKYIASQPRQLGGGDPRRDIEIY